MTIENCTRNDLDLIFSLYAQATALQKQIGSVTWPVFEREMVITEIDGNQQWKMSSNGSVACIWATTFDDPLIWEERNADPSVYIHRISTNPHFRGQQLVKRIVEWAIRYAKENGRQYVRLDTVGENKGLIAHYTQCGFRFLGLHTLQNTQTLPAHYHNASVSLFEIAV